MNRKGSQVSPCNTPCSKLNSSEGPFFDITRVVRLEYRLSAARMRYGQRARHIDTVDRVESFSEINEHSHNRVFRVLVANLEDTPDSENLLDTATDTISRLLRPETYACRRTGLPCTIWSRLLGLPSSPGPNRSAGRSENTDRVYGLVINRMMEKLE